MNSVEVGENELGQIVAVSAFENAVEGQVLPGNLLSQPMEIFGFQGFLGEGIAGVGVESGGNGDDAGLPLDQFRQRLAESVSVVFARCSRRQGEVEAIVAGVGQSGAGIAGMLMHGEKGGVLLIEKKRFGAVSVMHVEVEHGDAFAEVGGSVKGRESGGIQVAKSHSAVSGGVVSGRPQEAKSGLAVEGELQGVQSAANGSTGVFVDLRMGGRVAVKVCLRRLEAFEMSRRVP